MDMTVSSVNTQLGKKTVAVKDCKLTHTYWATTSVNGTLVQRINMQRIVLVWLIKLNKYTLIAIHNKEETDCGEGTVQLTIKSRTQLLQSKVYKKDKKQYK